MAGHGGVLDRADAGLAAGVALLPGRSPTSSAVGGPARREAVGSQRRADDRAGEVGGVVLAPQQDPPVAVGHRGRVDAPLAGRAVEGLGSRDERPRGRTTPPRRPGTSCRGRRGAPTWPRTTGRSGPPTRAAAGAHTAAVVRVHPRRAVAAWRRRPAPGHVEGGARRTGARDAVAAGGGAVDGRRRVHVEPAAVVEGAGIGRLAGHARRGVPGPAEGGALGRDRRRRCGRRGRGRHGGQPDRRSRTRMRTRVRGGGSDGPSTPVGQPVWRPPAATPAASVLDPTACRSRRRRRRSIAARRRTAAAPRSPVGG